MQVPSKFDQNSFESSNLTFVQLSPLSFKFIQLRSFYQISLNEIWSNLEDALYIFAQFKALSNSTYRRKLNLEILLYCINNTLLENNHIIFCLLFSFFT